MRYSSLDSCLHLPGAIGAVLLRAVLPVAVIIRLSAGLDDEPPPAA